MVPVDGGGQQNYQAYLLIMYEAFIESRSRIDTPTHLQWKSSQIEDTPRHSSKGGTGSEPGRQDGL